MANNLWASIAVQGLAAARPTIMDIPDGTFSMYYATDTGALSIWAGGAWHAGNSPLSIPVVAVAGLPVAAAANKGQMYYVTNLNSITIGATAAAGATGSGIVVSNGALWIVGGLPAQS